MTRATAVVLPRTLGIPVLYDPEKGRSMPLAKLTSPRRITNTFTLRFRAVTTAIARLGAVTDLAAVVPEQALLALLACVPAPAFMAGAAFTSTSPVAVTGLVGQAPHVAVSPVMPELLRSIVRRIHHSST